LNEKLTKLKDEFLMCLYDISRIPMVQNFAGFIQGEDAFLLRLYLNGPMQPKQLSEELKVTKGRITALILSLKTKKFISISKNPDDKRSIVITLSYIGRSYLEEKFINIEKYFDEIFQLIGVKEVEVLVDLLKNILSKVGRS